MRGYFFEALTSVDKPDRDENFVQTFRGLGQLMHLVQDMSVPEHTRDDGHYVRAFEAWVVSAGNVQFSADDGWIRVRGEHVSPVFFDASTLGSPNALAAIPFANLFDTNQYDGSNPDVTLNANIGLSEYTNANFFSPDTMFNDSFDYPARSSVEIEDFQIQDPRNPDRKVFRSYLRKVGDGDTGYRLATVPFLGPFKEDCVPNCDDLLYRLAFLDDEVYGDYAERLIPRAVGYSANLLDYFFRGRLQVTVLPNVSENKISSLWLKIKNITPSEEAMVGGRFALVCRYTPTGANPDGGEDKFVRAYDVDMDEGQVGYGGEIDLLFSLPYQGRIPLMNYGSVTCMLTYQGKLGNEAGAVIGKAFALGEIRFNEEWDNGLMGNYDWNHMTQSYFPNSLENGTTSNVVSEDGKLVKDNIRFMGKSGHQFNHSWLIFDGGGIAVTSSTYLYLEIDDISITPLSDAHTQNILLNFNDGRFRLIFCHPGHCYWNDWDIPTAVASYDFNHVFVQNLFSMIQDAGFETSEPLNLTAIQISQQIVNYNDAPAPEDEHQHMKVDFIRLIDEKRTP